MPFLFPEFTSNNIYTFPDLSVSFPGIISVQPYWEHTALFIYVVADEANDPFRESTPELYPTVVNLAAGARGLMVVHGHCAAFGLIICGRRARIMRFDHSCAVASPAFSLKNPGYLQEFFWRLFHPLVGRQIVGCDPTVRRLTAAEERWLLDSLEAAHKTAPSNLAMCRRVKAATSSRDGVVPRAYFAFTPIILNAHLMSLATILWLAVEDPRVTSNGGHLDDLPEANADVRTVLVKDTWRPLGQKSEQDFFTRIERTIPEGERVGLQARPIDYGLGDIEVQQWHSKTGMELCGAIVAIREQALSGTTGGLTTIVPGQLPAPLPLQQTCTWRLVQGPNSSPRERSHVRTVTNVVSRPLNEFKDTRELCQAIRDAIVGERATSKFLHVSLAQHHVAHKNLWEKARILHRDISLGHILILDKTDENLPGQDLVGFLHDFDYSSIIELDPSAAESGKGERDHKERSVSQTTRSAFNLVADRPS